MSTALAEMHTTAVAKMRNDGRFCRHCRQFLPITAFPAGRRRYICREHLYQRVKLPARLRVQADDKRRDLVKLWARCRTDSKNLGQTRIELNQSEIAEILKDKGIDLAYAIVPANSSQVLSPANCAVVLNETRRDLIYAHKLGGQSLYMSTLATLKCVDSQEQQPSEDTESVSKEENRGALQYILN
jgi:hypothetical protein